jgi:hypothetical protein
MNRLMLVAPLVLCLIAAGPPQAAKPMAAGQEKTAAMAIRAVPQTADWQKLSSLVGQWDGWMEEGGQRVDARLEVRMTADGSAIMHVLGRDTPQEMVTMFHPDGARLLATHYCAAHNQPRMASVAAPANQVAFEFVDGTNIAAGDGYMRHIAITFIDADHHDEAWTFQTTNGAMPPGVFHFTRVKK